MSRLAIYVWAAFVRSTREITSTEGSFALQGFNMAVGVGIVEQTTLEVIEGNIIPGVAVALEMVIGTVDFVIIE